MPHSVGKALTFIKEKVLTWESGMRKNVPKVLVVVTDGRSQDEVKKAAFVIQQSGKPGRHLMPSDCTCYSNSFKCSGMIAKGSLRFADFTLLFLFNLYFIPLVYI